LIFNGINTFKYAKPFEPLLPNEKRAGEANASSALFFVLPV
jgi:hypothetical protein